MTFDFYIGGYFSDTYRLKLEGSMIRCSEYMGVPSEHDKFVNVDGNKDWEMLVTFLKSCKWKRGYFDNSICDGTQWELKAIGEGFNIKTHGSNEYPSDFNEFLSILKRIVAVAGIKIK